MPVVAPTQDAYLFDELPSTNFGFDSEVHLARGGLAGTRVILLDFLIPTLCCPLFSADLTLRAVTPPSVSLPWRIARVIPSWSEGEVSWNDTGSGPWAVPGAEGVADISLTFPQAIHSTQPAGQTDHVFNRLARHVRDAIDSRAGVLRLHLSLTADAGTSFFAFGSREAVGFIGRPKLTIKMQDCEDTE